MHHADDLVGDLETGGDVRLVLADGADELIGLVLDVVAAPVDVRRPHEQEEDHPGEGDEEDGQQPCHGAGGFALGGNVSESDDLQGVVQQHQDPLPPFEPTADDIAEQGETEVVGGDERPETRGGHCGGHSS